MLFDVRCLIRVISVSIIVLLIKIYKKELIIFLKLRGCLLLIIFFIEIVIICLKFICLIVFGLMGNGFIY